MATRSLIREAMDVGRETERGREVDRERDVGREMDEERTEVLVVEYRRRLRAETRGTRTLTPTELTD
jgi:hypothetical protein